MPGNRLVRKFDSIDQNPLKKPLKKIQIPVSTSVAASQEDNTPQYQPTWVSGQETHLFYCFTVHPLQDCLLKHTEALERSDYSSYLFILALGHLGFHVHSQGDACLVLAACAVRKAKSSRWKSFLVRNIKPGHRRRTTTLITSKGKF